MFFEPFSIALAVIGANIPDFDHEFKQNQVLLIIAIGLIISIFLYILHLPVYFSLLLILLGIIFLLSSHRGFTHSILGMISIAISIFLIVYFGMDLSNYFNLNYSINLSLIPLNYLILTLILIFLASLFLNRKLALVFIVMMSIFLLSVYFDFIPVYKINVIQLVFSIFLGLFSHMILDSFTPSGIRPFIPFSQDKYFKKFGICIFLIILAAYGVLFFDKLIFFQGYFLNLFSI
ncbi:metal-dependent hydrolase [uncultured Methanobrevibacter sp.]|uniref:metal-dependent hydrolase n=1 Tax=uncultured Methanobrevibacter sp. TaxID=253161 RepID=UPI00262488E6